jgi:hypothetical protein
MKKEDVIGTWRAARYEMRAADGTMSQPYGAGPHLGHIIYHPNGTVSVLVVRTDIAKLDKAQSAADRIAALDRVTAYQGRFEVQGDKILHHIDVSLNPSWIGTTQERNAVLAGNRLTLSPPADAKGSQPHITWEKLSR